jgi:nicotinamide-nucleotide amidase
MIRGMKAAIIAIGSELLGTERLDTNSLKITAVFERFGVDLVAKSVVGDGREVIAAEFLRRLEGAEIVVVTGGLGPTADDVTRPAAALALGRGIEIDEGRVEQLRALFARFGRVMAEVNRRQAEVIEGAEILENPCGSAPGMRLEEKGSNLFLFPGVPRELEAMIEAHLTPWLEERLGEEAEGLERRVVKLACLPESEVEERIAPAYEQFGRHWISVLASPGEVKIWLAARGTPTVRRERLDEMQAVIVELAAGAAFSERPEDTLEVVVGSLLERIGATLTTAESCTGGMVAERLTRVPGSSPWFSGGVVSYSNALKRVLLGVPKEMLEVHGAVSEPVARCMAEGVRERLGSSFGISITGIAGPAGGSEEKPVGTVHIAVAGANGTEHWQGRFPGGREQVRQQSGQLALELLRRRLLRELEGDAA